MSLNLEIKHANDYAAAVPSDEEKEIERELAKIVCQTVREFGPAPGRLLLSSFSITALEVCQDMLPDIPRSYLVIVIPEDWEATARRLGCTTLSFHHTSATREQVEPVPCPRTATTHRLTPRAPRRPAGRQIEAVSRQITTLCYTVNDAGRAAELLSWGVAGVFSDCPHTILAALPGA